MSTNRVVVTGYGVTSPIGNTPEEFWNSLHEGKIGIKPITKFDASEIPVFNAGEIQDFPYDFDLFSQNIYRTITTPS